MKVKLKQGIFNIMAIIVLLIIIILIIVNLTGINKYTFALKQNWNINLPINYEKIYEKEGSANILGEGYRYHIFKYKSSKKLENSLKWVTKTDLYENNIMDILKELGADEKYYPEFDAYKYYTTTNSDNSRLYIIWNTNSNLVYIIEDMN